MWGRRLIAPALTVVLAVVLAWAAWAGWRWEFARRVYADEDFPAPDISASHIAALRKLTFAWNTRIESGGPVVDSAAPYGSPDMASDLGAIIGTRDRVAIAKFHREVSWVLIWALENGELAEGQYRLAHLDNAAMERRLRLELAGVPPKRIERVVAELPRLEPDGYFHFTTQHRALLHALRFEWPDPQSLWIVAEPGGYFAPAVHFKRPFGDMTAFEVDMGTIVGLPAYVGDKINPELDRLWWEMWPALQTFAEHARIAVAAAPTAGK
jgi:hypothetical protein